MNVCIADDHFLVSVALKELIQKKFPDFNIQVIHSNKEFANLGTQLKDIRLFITDLNFNGKMGGFEMIEQIKKNHTLVPVIVLSMHSESIFLNKSFSLGAKGYIVKTDPPEEIFNAIKEVLNGGKYISISMRTSALQSSDETLSSREKEIANLVAAGKSSKVIGELLQISSRTVETHRRNIMKKLNVINTAQLISILKNI